MTLATSPGPDPRTLAPVPAEESVRPVVALPRQGLPAPVIAALIVLAAIILFAILNARRTSVVEVSETVPQGPVVAGPAPAPPLVIPGGQPQVQLQPQPQIFIPPASAAPQRTAPQFIAPQPVRQQQPQIVYVPQPAAPVPQIQGQAAPQRVPGEPALVIDTTAGGGAAAADGGEAATANAAAGGAATAIAGTRSRAGQLANRSTTVPQGTLIPAVMETAFDSSRPGLARALVSRDIRGFDGRRVLIPRGSRLIGEYRSDVQPGQRRALVNWFRLIRPDGATISIGSPATDTLGRGGIRANVDNHFFQRFAGALLRSTVDLGLTLAAGAASGGLVVIPGSVGGGVSNAVQPAEIPPTLTVRPGRSISVFVARDLDFTGAERRR